jgi:uncharacterized membrane protein YfcA
LFRLAVSSVLLSLPAPHQLLGLVLVGGLAGFINTVSASGGVVAVPGMIGLGLSADLANGTNRLSAAISTLTATVRFHQAGVIPWGVALQLVPAIVLGSLGGALVGSSLDPGGALLAVTASLVVVLVLLLARPQRWLQGAENLGETLQVTPVLQLAMLAIGFWTGFISLGSGTMTLLALAWFGRQNLARANHVKIVLRAAGCLVALIVFMVRFQVAWSWALPQSLAGMLGALIGSKVALGEQASRWIYGTLIAVLGLELLLILTPPIGTLAGWAS